MKFETGTQVQHRDNPNWKAVVLRNADRPSKPECLAREWCPPVSHCVVVDHNGEEKLMGKSVLRMSFHADAKKEFGEVVS